jgi:hypothetical protein
MSLSSISTVDDAAGAGGAAFCWAPDGAGKAAASVTMPSAMPVCFARK